MLNAPDGAYERVFSINADRMDLAKAIGQGMTLALSMARAGRDEPAPMPAPKVAGVVIPFPLARTSRRAEPT
ncbi:hypothetical protein JKG68_07260 [Microvirga aerilata]|uniref:Uncharacterized protein n=1 Tax=Microvirga aerilata TaxID=670292 RepID=A0A937CYS6_9HYPH|nr:hypothetical protein [Microvirga aerilata]MBL0403756.1 hypothetical protein [Microvirga aerilata]